MSLILGQGLMRWEYHMLHLLGWRDMLGWRDRPLYALQVPSATPSERARRALFSSAHSSSRARHTSGARYASGALTCALHCRSIAHRAPVTAERVAARAWRMHAPARN